LSQQDLRDLELGKESLEVENYDEAIGYFKSYLEKSPEDADVHFQLGLALLKKGSLKEAVDEFKQSIDLDPKNEEMRTLIKKSIFDEANTFFSEGKNDIGMRYLTAYLTINPDDVDTHIILANEFIKMGSTRNALACMNKAVSLDPKNPEVIKLLDYFSDGFH
jgi:Flp pilus assembly protein TadD